jgi:hypothetical protein
MILISVTVTEKLLLLRNKKTVDRYKKSLLNKTLTPHYTLNKHKKWLRLRQVDLILEKGNMVSVGYKRAENWI